MNAGAVVCCQSKQLSNAPDHLFSSRRTAAQRFDERRGASMQHDAGAFDFNLLFRVLCAQRLRFEFLHN